MATRSWTKQYLELRAKAQARRKDDITLEVKDESELKTDPSLANAPWIPVYEQTKKDIIKILNFGDRDDAKHEEEIQQITSQITGLLKRGSNNCGRIAQLGNPKDVPVSVIDKTAVLNAIRHLSQELGQLNKDFASSQKSYAHRLRELESGAGASLLPEDFNSKSTWGDALDGSKPLTDDQQEQLRQLRDQASQRDAEIIKIVQAVNELAMMFKQLNTLIHDQGTVLARIDYNIEQAKTQVSKGRVELEQANKISKKSRTMKVIAVLALVVTILLIVWIYKISN